MTKTIIPLGKHITIRPAEAEPLTTKSGLVAPPNEKVEDKCEGTVVAIGDEVKHLKPGDEVVYEQFSNATKIKFPDSKNDVDLLIMHSDDVIGKWGTVKK